MLHGTDRGKLGGVEEHGKELSGQLQILVVVYDEVLQILISLFHEDMRGMMF